MRRQEQEKTECNKYNGNQLYVGGRRRDDDSFPEKKGNFLFQPLAQSGRGCEELGVESSKDFEICVILEKEPRSARRTSYQADRHGYLPEVKIESPEHMPDQVNNKSVRLVGTKKSEPDQRLAEDLI
jgi:hypothetical protein